MNNDYEYHELYLDSSDASTGATANVDPLNVPLFNLPYQLKDVESFKVLQVEIPNSYCVPAGASITVVYYSDPAGTTFTKKYNLIATGIPSGSQIAADLSTKLFADSGVSGLAGWTSNYLICSFVPGTSTLDGLSYFKFENANSFSGVQTYSISVSDQRSEDVLGMRIGTLNAGTLVAGKRSITSPRPVLITGPPYIYVASNAVGNLCRTYLPAGAALLSGGVSSPQMAKVPVIGESGHFIIWNDSNSSHWYHTDTISTLSQIDLYCQLGNYGGYIDFQGLNFSVKLGVLVRKQYKTTSGERGGFVTQAPNGMNFPISR